MESLSNKKRVHSDSEHTAPEAKRIQLDLLDTLDDSNELMSGQDLDSFIKSFQDEISPPSEANLEFLLEASDDELGLPPTGEFSWLDDQENCGLLLDYAQGEVNVNGNGEYVALDGLFSYTDLDFGSSDLSIRSESLPAQ